MLAAVPTKTLIALSNTFLLFVGIKENFVFLFLLKIILQTDGFIRILRNLCLRSKHYDMS